MSIREIKRQARQTLKGLSGKYLLFLMPTLLSIFYMGIEVHQSYIINQGIEMSVGANYFPLLITIILLLLTLSASFTMIEVVRYHRTSVTFSESTTAFSRDYIGKILILAFVKWLLLLVWSLVLIIGVIILAIGVFALLTNLKAGTNNKMSILLIVLGVMVCLVGLVIYINRYYAYSQSEFILYDRVKNQNYLGSIAAIEESKYLMDGYKWSYFWLHFSFILWIFGSMLSFGLLYFYVLPYLLTSKAIFYQKLKDRYDQLDEPLEGDRLPLPGLTKKSSPMPD
ncbi:DUF975 family protein [Streptococcus ictaluri]|uniref:PF06161 family protein n=1 Tax=Streptococcus ictaluri 707-05 TaxID=764299 RepID=G5JZI1_9STRE|nr:DUF975 family protein [Streptococcus ictaluri]EHI70878.1 hypothetical protein STRIC_0692 [Streptococcus ictaluri 707-05]